MKKLKLILLPALAGLLCLGAAAQTVYFPTGTNLCEPGTYKLVFYDEFNGYKGNPNQLDTTKWHTYYVWAKMPVENDDWSASRLSADNNTIWRDENVKVGGGFCKLQLKQQWNSWKCSSCSGAPVNRPYTGGMLSSFFKFNAFSFGRFEARIRMPISNYTHSTFWLQSGSGRDEIDIAEGYGDPYWTNRRTTYGCHRWERNSAGTVIFHKENVSKFPSQTWWDLLKGSYFNQGNLHTYACEWEPNFIRYYLDNHLVEVVPRYKRAYPLFSSTNCNPKPGVSYLLNPAYPPDSSGSVVLFTLGADKGVAQFPLPHWLTGNGELQIDYIRVWQKDPDHQNEHAPGYTMTIHDLCDRKLAGDNAICDNAIHTYTMTGAGAVTTGAYYYWSVSSNLDIIAQSITTISVRKKTGAVPGPAWVQFNDDNPQCGSVRKNISLSAPVTPVVNVIKIPVTSGGMTIYYYYFIVLPPIDPAANYKWIISFGGGSGYIINSPFFFTPSLSPGASWTLHVTNGCGTTHVNGSVGGGGNIMAQQPIQVNIADTASIRADMENAIANIPADQAWDSLYVANTMRTVLEKYEATAGNHTIAGAAQTTLGVNDVNKPTTASRLYPNPVSSKEIFIEPAGSYDKLKELLVQITDIKGAQLTEAHFFKHLNPIKLDIEKLPPGTYLVNISQGDRRESVKFIRE